MIYSLPLVVVIVFLTFTLIIGLYYSGKTTNLKEYAVGHKNFSTAALVGTVLATTFGGGGLIRNVEQVHFKGLFWIMLLFWDLFDMVLLIPLSLRMTAFMENLSIAETIGQVYGKWPRIFTALASTCSSITFLAMQVTVIAQAIGMFITNVNPIILSVIAALIVIFYSTFGGIRAVTITDVLQCLTFMIILPCLAWLVFRKLNKPFVDVFTVLSAYENFQFSHVFQWSKQSVQMLFIGLSCIYIAPYKVQRVYMSSNVIQARKVFFFQVYFSYVLKVLLYS